MSIGEEDEDRSRMKGIYQRSNFFFFFVLKYWEAAFKGPGDTMWPLAIGYSSVLTPSPPAAVSARGRWLSGTL